MFLTDEYVATMVRARHEEADRARHVSEAWRAAAADGRGRSWLWRIEPGMEGAFRDLLGWLLSGQREAPVEAQAPPALEAAASPSPLIAASPAAVVAGWCSCWRECCTEAA